MTQLVIGILLVAIAGLLVRTQLRRITILEYERGLLYVGGRFRSLLEPGQYWIWASSRMVTKVDVRLRVATVPGQEVLTADGIAVKVSVVAEYRVSDPVAAINGQVNYEAALYTELQLAIRQLISGESIDALLEKRPQLADQLTELAKPGSSRLGLTLLRADVKDLTLPGDLKKLFAQVTKARQEGLAALERARGETAALRNLTNAAHLVADNPALMQLRLLQVVDENSGNTIVLGVPQSSTPLPIATARTERIQPPTSESPDT